jgi:hypothetical protein
MPVHGLNNAGNLARPAFYHENNCNRNSAKYLYFHQRRCKILRSQISLFFINVILTLFIKFRIMPLKCLFVILAVMLNAHCSSPGNMTQTDLETSFADIIKKDLEQGTPENEHGIKVDELIILKIDTVTSNTLDSQLLVKSKEKIEYCIAMSELYVSMAESNARLGKLLKKLKKPEAQKNPAEDIGNDINMGKLYKDSAVYYQQLDSSIRARISRSPSVDSLFRVRVFLKGTGMVENDTAAIEGARLFYITKDHKIVQVPELK